MAFEMNQETSFHEIFVNKPHTGIEISEISYKKKDEVIILRPDMTKEEIMTAHPRWAREYGVPSGSKTERDRSFLELKIVMAEKRDAYVQSVFSSAYNNIILNFIHVPALRGNPERNYKKTTVGPKFPGTFEIYAASIINHWQANNDPRINDRSPYVPTAITGWQRRPFRRWAN